MRVIDVTVSFIGTVIRAVVIIVCGVVILNLGKKAYDFGFRVFTEGPMAEAPGRDIVVSVEDDEGLRDVAKKLEEKGLTSDWMLFFIQAKLSEFKGSIDPGTYRLNNSMTSDELMAVLTKADLEEENESEEYVPEELTEGIEEVYDDSMPIESGSDLVDGELEEGETPYEGEDGTVDIEVNTGEETEEGAGE